MKKYVFPILCSLVFSACGSSDPDPTVQDDELSISSCHVVVSNNLSENFSSPIGLYILDGSGQPYDPTSYKNSASLISGNWLVSTPVYITGAGKLYAYYPYSSSDNLPSLNVDVSNQVDLLYSKNPVSIGFNSSSLSIKLYHALSQLQVSVEDEEISQLSVRFPLTGKFNIMSGLYSDLVYGQASSSTGKMLVIPHIASGAELAITLKSGSQYTYSLDGKSFSAGENYTYQFKLSESKEKLEFRSISVEDWVSDFIHKDYLKR